MHAARAPIIALGADRRDVPIDVQPRHPLARPALCAAARPLGCEFCLARCVRSPYSADAATAVPRSHGPAPGTRQAYPGPLPFYRSNEASGHALRGAPMTGSPAERTLDAHARRMRSRRVRQLRAHLDVAWRERTHLVDEPCIPKERSDATGRRACMGLRTSNGTVSTRALHSRRPKSSAPFVSRIAPEMAPPLNPSLSFRSALCIRVPTSEIACPLK